MAWSIEHMGNGTEKEAVAFYAKALNAPPKVAATIFHGDCVKHWNEKHIHYSKRTSRIQQDPDTKLWRGKEVPYAMRAGVGKPRIGEKPTDIRVMIRERIGKEYLTPVQVRQMLEELFGPDRVKSVFTQARTRKPKMLLHDAATNTWRYFTTPPPEPKDFAPDFGDNRRAEYVRKYGSMPRGVRHKVGDTYSRETSQLLAYISQQSGEKDLDWCDKERDRARAAGVFHYDQKTGETIGILTYRAEQAAAEVKQPEEAPEESQDGEWEGGYLQSMWVDDPEPENSDAGFAKYRIGKHIISQDILHRIERMKEMSRQDAGKWLQAWFSFKIDRQQLIDALIEERIFADYPDGNIEGIEGRRERAEEKQAREQERHRQNEERQKREEEERQKNRALYDAQSQKERDAFYRRFDAEQRKKSSKVLDSRRESNAPINDPGAFW
jgi:hypothetical protein